MTSIIHPCTAPTTPPILRTFIPVYVGDGSISFGELQEACSAAKQGRSILRESSLELRSRTLANEEMARARAEAAELEAARLAREREEEEAIKEVSPWLILLTMQLVLFLLGMFIDPIGIMMITLPVFLPLSQELGFDLIWFGVLFTVNMELAFITPPFGMNLFYMKGVVPAGITMGDIYRSILPFILLELLGLILLVLFPQLVLWLPNLMIQ